MTPEEAVIQVVGIAHLDARLDVQEVRLDDIEKGLKGLGEDLDKSTADIVDAIKGQAAE